MIGITTQYEKVLIQMTLGIPVGQPPWNFLAGGMRYVGFSNETFSQSQKYCIT